MKLFFKIQWIMKLLLWIWLQVPANLFSPINVDISYTCICLIEINRNLKKYKHLKKWFNITKGIEEKNFSVKITLCEQVTFI